MFWEIYSVKRSHNKNKKSGLFRRHVVEALYKLALVQKKKRYCTRKMVNLLALA